MADVELSGAPSAGAGIETGAGAPAPSSPTASPEPSSLEGAAREAMSGGDPAEGAPEGVLEAKPDGEGLETPEAAAAEGEGTVAEEKEGERDELAELDFADLPAARKEYLKRDPEARAAWYFRQDMERLGMTVPEAREFRKAFGTPESARFALGRAVDYAQIEQALASDAPEAHIHFLENLHAKFPEGAARLVRTVAEHLDKVDPGVALERDATRLNELLSGLDARDPLRKEALDIVWEMVDEKHRIAKQEGGRAPNPDREELESYRQRERERETRARQEHWTATNQAANGAIRSWVEESFANAKKALEKLGVKDALPEQVQNDIGETLFRETSEYLRTHPLFQQQYINARDSAATPEEGRAAALKLVERWGKRFLLDLAETRIRPYTHGVLRTNQRRLSHAREVGKLSELGGTAATVGSPVRISEGASIEERARALLR